MTMGVAFKLAVPLGALLLLSACGGGTRLDSSSSAVQVATALPAPDSTTIPVDIAPYRIVPGDELTVSVFGAPELDKVGVVDGGGEFALPLTGSIHAAGKTTDQISAVIQEKLRGAYLKNPRVAVNVKPGGNQQTVTVDGEVGQPGIYPITGRMSLQQAIATAHGASTTANIRNVIVFRTVNQQKMAAMFDLKEIRSGRAPDPQIYGNDIVVVGENAVQKFLQNSPGIFPVLGRFIPFIF
jgi:polysaccharide export outer membrane protein